MLDNGGGALGLFEGEGVVKRKVMLLSVLLVL